MNRRQFAARAGSAVGAALLAAPAASARAASLSEFEFDVASPFGASLMLFEPSLKTPSLPLQRRDGERTAMNAYYPGEVVVATFWATWCGACRREMPEVAAMRPQLEAIGVRVLPISLDAGSDPFPRIDRFNQRYGVDGLEAVVDVQRFSFYTLFGQFSPDYAPTPSTFFIDKRGGVVGVIRGFAHLHDPEGHRFLRHLVEA